MKALSHRRHRDGLALGNQQRGFPPTVDEIHPAYNEEEADKTDEYGACGKGISQGKNHAVRSGLAYAGIRHSSIFCMRKTLILYCINLLRYCPDPGPAGDMPCNTGSFRAVSALFCAETFSGGAGFPSSPGSQDEGIPHRKRQARFLWEFHISSGKVQQLIHRLFACVTYFFLICFLRWKQSVFASVFHHLFQPDSGSGPCGASQRRV